MSRSQLTLAFLMALSLMLAACEEPFDPDLDAAEPRLVIEANVNNIDTPAANVKLSRTAPYLDPDTERPVSGALVVISSDEITDTLREVDTIPGLYLSDQLVGQVGMTYRLEVVVEGERYTSESPMLPNFRIDSLAAFKDAPVWDPFNEQYVVWGFGQDPAPMGDLALFQIYQNDRQLLAVDGYMYVQDDKFTNGQYLAAPVGSFGLDAVGDTIVLEVSSLTQPIFDYISQVIDLQYGFGGPFDPIPTNPVTNIEGGALGHFRVSAMSRDTIILPE